MLFVLCVLLSVLLLSVLSVLSGGQALDGRDVRRTLTDRRHQAAGPGPRTVRGLRRAPPRGPRGLQEGQPPGRTELIWSFRLYCVTSPV